MKILLKKAQTYEKWILASTQWLGFTRNTTWLDSYFSVIKKPKYKFSLNLCSGNQSVIAGVCIFDTIAASLSYILIWTSTYGSVQYKRKIQNRKIQSERVLVLQNTHIGYWIIIKYPNKIFFVESAHRKSKGVLILRTFPATTIFPATTKKLTQPHKCIVH